MKQIKILAAAIAAAAAGASAFAATNEPIQPIPAVGAVNEAKVELGKKLFFDPRLSKSGFLSCNSCHNLATGGADNMPSSIGHGWQLGPINSPTVLNARFNVAQFWDGRAADLKAQAGGPIANPGEMAFSHEDAITTLSSIPQYVAEFKQVFGSDKIGVDEITGAIAAFEETLVTPNSRFDKYLNGDEKAITAEEKDGYKLFKEKGCVSCHNGVAVGGGSFQKFGVVKPYKTEAVGRYGVTKKEEDKYAFKVPTLRNVELTAPYFHDASAWTLNDAVNTMAEYQLGVKLSAEESAKIVAFLKSLTGEQPKVALPVLPPSSPTTPKPNRG